VDPRTPPSQLYRIIQFALAPERREVLHHRIALRFEQMLRAGLIEEVRGLRSRPDLHPDLPAIRAVGYRQVWGYLNGEYDIERCESRAVAATRQLAKRQLTWLRKWPDLEWLLTDEDGNLAQKSVSHQDGAEKKPLERLLNCIGSPP
jgi:tRNA dimethylallyltransferase